MKTEDAILANICDYPDDDALRLIYADWLEEHDQPERAEFIRAQIELSRLSKDDPRWDTLEDRSWALEQAHRNEWLHPLRAFLNNAESEAIEYCGFERGFVGRLPLEGVR